MGATVPGHDPAGAGQEAQHTDQSDPTPTEAAGRGQPNWLVLLFVGVVLVLIVASAIAVDFRRDQTDPDFGEETSSGEDGQAGGSIEDDEDGTGTDQGTAVATTTTDQTEAPSTTTRPAATPRRCLELDQHRLAPPDDRNIRITGPAEPVDYPGYVEGAFESLEDDDVLWVISYAYDAGRYWPAERAAEVNRRSGTWEVVEGYYLGNPDQSGAEFDVLVAQVDVGSAAHQMLETMFNDDMPPFDGWTPFELSDGLILHDCARLVRR